MSEMEQLRAALVAMQAEQAAQQQEIARLRTDNQNLLAAHTAAMSAIPNLTVAVNAIPDLIAAAKAQAAPDRRILTDMQGVGKPYVFKSVEAEFYVWSCKIESYMLSIYPTLEAPLTWSIDVMGEITREMIDLSFGTGADLVDQVDELEDKCTQVRSLLHYYTDGESFDIVNAVPSWNGLEAWRRLTRRYNPFTGGRRRNILSHRKRVTVSIPPFDSFT